MSPEIVVAIVSGLCTILSVFGGMFVSARLTAYRIEELEKKVEKHNNLVERMYCAEQAIAVINTKIDKE